MLANYYYPYRTHSHHTAASSVNDNNELFFTSPQRQQQRTSTQSQQAQLPDEQQLFPHDFMKNNHLYAPSSSNIHRDHQYDGRYDGFNTRREKQRLALRNTNPSAASNSFDINAAAAADRAENYSLSKSAPKEQRKKEQHHQASSSSTTTTPPPYDITEDVDEVNVSIDVPGVKVRDIKVYYKTEDRLLFVSAQRKRKNRFEVAFEDVFSVADNIEADKISASLADGVLTLIFPKRELFNEVRNIVVTEGLPEDTTSIEALYEAVREDIDEFSGVGLVDGDDAMMMDACISPEMVEEQNNELSEEDDGAHIVGSGDDFDLQAIIDDFTDHEIIEL